MVRVRPEVARLVEFGQLNLLEPLWPLLTRFGLAAGRGVLPQRDDLLQPRHPARRDGAVRIGSQARRPAVRGSLGELHRLPRVVRAAWHDRGTRGCNLSIRTHRIVCRPPSRSGAVGEARTVYYEREFDPQRGQTVAGEYFVS